MHHHFCEICQVSTLNMNVFSQFIMPSKLTVNLKHKVRKLSHLTFKMQEEIVNEFLIFCTTDPLKYSYYLIELGIVPNFEDSDFRVEEEHDIQSPDLLVKECAMCTIYNGN